MRFLAFLILLSAIVISACGAYFSIVGLKLLFVGGGISIIVMGTALEVGKLITATFLKQKWDEIGWFMKTYLMIATLFLMGITSIGIYGYLSAGYTATSIVVQGYEQQIASNTSKVNEIEKEIASIKNSKYNESEIASIEENRRKFSEQRAILINQRRQQIDNVRKTNEASKDASADIISAKQGLEISKSSTENDVARELDQIKLYNSRLEILDKEVQRWIDEGSGGLFKKSGLDKAREVKTGQEKERNDIDSQIKASQDRISKLREQYTLQVKTYNDRVTEIENRSKTQRNDVEIAVKNLEKEISDIESSIVAYNKEMDLKIESLNKKKNDLSDQGKNKILEYQEEIKKLNIQNVEYHEKIIHTDVGTFKFIANSFGIPLDKAVNYFIWSIMIVFDPLAVCLLLAFNSLVADSKKKTEKNKEKIVSDIPSKNENLVGKTLSVVGTSIEPTSTPTVTVSDLTQSAHPDEHKNVPPPPPPPPPAPHGIVSGKVHPRQ